MHPKPKQYIALFIWVIALASVWCVALPRLAQLPPLRQHIDRMEAKNIHVDAMFYTELDWESPTGAAWR